MDASAPNGRTVLITWPDYDVGSERLGGALERAGLQVRLEPKRGGRSTDEMAPLLDGVAGAIVSTDPFDAGLLSRCPSLRVIARVGVGVDSVDLEAATVNGVAVTVTPGANEETVADHALALMLASVRRICEHDGGVREGAWNRTGGSTPWTLHGATVGIVGFGRIGTLVARRLRGFGVRVLVTDPMGVADGGPPAVELDELLGRSDIVTLHAPLRPETQGMIGERELGLMRSNAILVNTARGGMVDEEALLEALRSGAIRGAALDVFAEEPPPISALLARPEVVLSPHNAGLSTESIEEMTLRATTSVIDVLSGRLPENLANPAVAPVLRATDGAGDDA